MKRLINDISTAKAITFLYDQKIDEDQLILWTILKLQHPSLAEFFWNNPMKIHEVGSYTDKSAPITNIVVYDTLLGKSEVKRVFQYPLDEKTIVLDLEFLEKMKFQTTQEIEESKMNPDKKKSALQT